MEEQLYDVTYGVIYRIMELIDGYRGLSRIDVVLEETGEHLKNNPFIELHDTVPRYIRYDIKD